MNIDAADLYSGLQYGTAQGASGAGLYKKLLEGTGRDAITGSPLLAPLINYLDKEREQFLRTTIPLLPWSSFKLFDTTGDRQQYDSLFGERRRRLTVLTLTSWLWERPEDIAALEDCIWAVCDEYSWSLPAFMEGTSLSKVEDNAVHLALTSCETGFVLAECCAMLEGLLAPAVLARARAEVRRRVIDSYLKHGALRYWEMMDNNWCAVCAGSIAAAALYLVEDNLLLAGLLQRLWPTLERYTNSFYADGVSPEGLAYWTYGMSFYVNFGDLLQRRTGGKINIFDDPRFEKIAAFQQYCYFPGGATLTFSDAGMNPFKPGLTCYLAEHIEGVSVPSLPYRLILANDKANGKAEGPGHNAGHFFTTLRDLLWTREPVRFLEEKPRCLAFPDAQWLLCSGEGETGFAAKGGHNGESHNHNDVGSFIYYKKGAMVFCDLGSGEYTKDYFSDKRYTTFCTRSESHSVPVIGGQGQETGKEFRARDCRISAPGDAEGDTSAAGEMLLDIAGAYKVPGLLRLERQFHFDIQTGVLVLKDTFTFGEKPLPPALPVVERFVTLFAPRIEKGTVYIDTGGSVSSLSFDSADENSIPVTGTEQHIDHDGNAVTVYTIDFPFRPGEKTFTAEFRIA